MRCFTKLSFLSLTIFTLLFVLSCKQNVDTNYHQIINAKTPLNTLKYWKAQEINGEENTVYLHLSRDVDLLFWTRENGEVINKIDKKKLKTQDSLCYSEDKDPNKFTFTFSKPGTYILSIYQKPNLSENFNKDDVDFRGKVVVGKKSIKLLDTGYAETCRKQAQYRIVNNSNFYSDGNVIDELVFVSSLGRKWDSKRRCNYAVYKTQWKYTNINLQPGKSMIMLLPIGENINDTRYGYAILKPVVKDGDTLFYVQTTNLVSLDKGVTELSKRKSTQGFMGNQCNGILKYIGNDQFEMPW